MNVLQTHVANVLSNAGDALTVADTTMAGILEYRAVLARVQADPGFAGLAADVQEAVSFRANDDLSTWDALAQSLRDARTVLNNYAAKICASLGMGRGRRRG